MDIRGHRLPPTSSLGFRLYGRHPITRRPRKNGALSGYAALGIAGLMLGALGTHVPNGFFMNWFGTLKAGAEGYEYHLLALGLAGVVAIEGSGALSLDRRLARSASARSHSPISSISPASPAISYASCSGPSCRRSTSCC